MAKMLACKLCIILMQISMLVLPSSGQTPDLTYVSLEEQPDETFVANIAADSRDLINLTDAEYNLLTYQLLSKGNAYAKLYSLNEQNGRLVTAGKIDREKVCSDLELCILGLDVAIYKNEEPIKFIRINIDLKDVNDHAPVFPSPEVTLSVSESVAEGFVILTSAATDQDTGTNNSVQSYQFVTAQDVFRLKIQTDIHGLPTLGIEVNKLLDHELESKYLLEIVAKDGGSPQMSGTVTVTIMVTDENDNSPVFSKPEYTAKTVENPKQGTVIVQVSAEDKDSGTLGEIIYKFSPRFEKVAQIFSINESTGAISVSGIVDYETDKRFFFPVLAYDKGSPQLSAQVMVAINVTDLNDNAPKININLPPGGDQISEAAEKDRYIANVVVSDIDSGLYGKITCNLQDNEYFQLITLYTDMYKIVLKKTLDRELLPQHNVTVFCEDGGNPKHTNQTSFSISVSDVNDNPPMFTETTYNVSIYENNKVGDTIAIVTTEDKDAGRNAEVSYAFLDDYVENVFTIDSLSGVISANYVFDRETQDELQIRVMASDNGVPKYSSITTVIVTILDRNDNTPRFFQSIYTFSIAENQAAGTVVGRLIAHDYDAGLNGHMTFTVPGNYSDLFSIETNGQIRTDVILDREINNLYDFHVIAQDQGDPSRRSSANVIIVIEDVNDNVPNVTFPNMKNNTVTISEAKQAGSIVTQVMASDPDLGINSKLLYLLMKGNEARLFKMDNRTGVVTLDRMLNRDQTGPFTLLVSVQDSGAPLQTSWSNLVVVVTKDEANKNVIIVIAVASVTVTLSAAMIIVICIIRRQDSLRNRHQQNQFSDHKKMFILQWLACLSTSTKEIHKISTDRVDMSKTETSRLTDRKPIITRSPDSTSSDGSHDNIKTGNVKSDEDEGFVETSGGTLMSHDSGKGDSIRERHNSEISHTTSLVSDVVFHSLPRCPPSLPSECDGNVRFPPSIHSETGSDMRCSDAVSIPESWNQRPHNVRFNRVVSFDDEMLRPNYSFSSFRGSSNQDSKISTISNNNNNFSSYSSDSNDLGLSFDSQTLQRHLRGNYPHQRSQFSNALHPKKAQRRPLPPISATPEPYDPSAFNQSNCSSFEPHPRSPSYQKQSVSFDNLSGGTDNSRPLQFHGGRSQSDSDSQSSRGTTLKSFAINPTHLERVIENNLNENLDCIV